MEFPEPDVKPIWPADFEHHLKGKTFLDEAAQMMQPGSPTPRSTRNNPAVYDPESLEDLKSHYYEVKGWDDE